MSALKTRWFTKGMESGNTSSALYKLDKTRDQRPDQPAGVRHLAAANLARSRTNVRHKLLNATCGVGFLRLKNITRPVDTQGEFS